MSGAIVNPVEIRDAGGDNKWLAAAMMILPSRSDSWACHGLLGPLECFRFSCSVGKKLGLVALPPQVSFPCAGPIHLSSLTNSAGLAPDLQDWLRGYFGHDAKH